ncbi:repeat protein [Moumouvirus goulette]|uniref:Repeat protein n=1 Tax=Moumouvirus goulette TaxID=1247379 RepID=M1PAY7_9VIRU|nr:repeat protein [Moumouvirus goulette]AGF85024.1 repeat protein [Moumouvirus goulette]
MTDFEKIEDSIRKILSNNNFYEDCYFFIKDIIRYNRYDCIETYYHIAKEYGIDKIDGLLLRVIDMKNIIIVKKLIDLGVDVNTPNTFPGKAIEYACQLYNCEKILDVLLKNGADLNINSNKFFQAACITNIEILQLLLDYGIVINESDPIIFSCICNLIKRKKYDKLSLLIKYGININTILQTCPLIFSDEEDKKTIDLLLDFDIDYYTIIKLLCGVNLKN